MSTGYARKLCLVSLDSGEEPSGFAAVTGLDIAEVYGLDAVPEYPELSEGEDYVG
jgi:hypothetical protein